MGIGLYLFSEGGSRYATPTQDGEDRIDRETSEAGPIGGLPGSWRLQRDVVSARPSVAVKASHFDAWVGRFPRSTVPGAIASPSVDSSGLSLARG